MFGFFFEILASQSWRCGVYVRKRWLQGYQVSCLKGRSALLFLFCFSLLLNFLSWCSMPMRSVLTLTNSEAVYFYLLLDVLFFSQSVPGVWQKILQESSDGFVTLLFLHVRFSIHQAPFGCSTVCFSSRVVYWPADSVGPPS